MIRGLSFEVPNKWYPVIYLIMKEINIRKYFWFLAYEDVYGHEFKDYFEKGRYPGSEFEQVIKEEECYAVFLNLQAYLKEEEIVKIDNYQGFLESKCKFIILIDDNSYVSIFSKDPEILDTIHQSAILNGFEKIEQITDKNEILKRFYVM
jgi:hypothetical protein